MSAAAPWSTALPHPAPERRPDGIRPLRVVDAPARRRRPRRAFGVIAVVGAFLIAGAQMALSILTTQGAYEVAALTQQQRDLTYQSQILYDEVAGLSSPQYLAANASALGMVIGDAPSYLRLSDGAFLGAGEMAGRSASIDAATRGSVPNALITGTPLVTDPDAMIAGAPAPDTILGADGVVSDTPPPITDGLPTPTTH